MEKWTIELCESINGTCYAEKDLLGELAIKDRLVLERLTKTRIKFTSYDIEHLKKTGKLEKIEDALYKLKFALGNTHIRYLGFFDWAASPPIFYVLLAFRKKSLKIPPQYIAIAKERYKDYRKK